MSIARRPALSLARQLARTSQRRFASHESNSHHGEPVNESLGPAFYGLLATIPAVYILWSVSQPSDDKEAPFFTRMIKERLDAMQQEFKERDTLHTQLLQQAADDYMLFSATSVAPTRRKVPVNNIESLSTWSHQNVQPGWGSINLTKVIEHIEKESAEQTAQDEERYKKRLADGYYERTSGTRSI